MQCQGDIIWLVHAQSYWRMILLKDGLPELDHRLLTTWTIEDPVELLLDEIDSCLLAWSDHSSVSRPLGWWISSGPAEQSRLQHEIQVLRDELCLMQPIIDSSLGDLLLDDAGDLICKGETASLLSLAMAGSRGLL